MSTAYTCPGCGKSYRVKPTTTKVRCPNCQTVGKVQHEEELDDWDEPAPLRRSAPKLPAKSRRSSTSGGGLPPKKKKSPSKSRKAAFDGFVSPAYMRKLGYVFIFTGFLGSVFPLLGLELRRLRALSPEHQLTAAQAMLIFGIGSFIIGVILEFKEKREAELQSLITGAVTALLVAASIFLGSPLKMLLPAGDAAVELADQAATNDEAPGTGKPTQAAEGLPAAAVATSTPAVRPRPPVNRFENPVFTPGFFDTLETLDFNPSPIVKRRFVSSDPAITQKSREERTVNFRIKSQGAVFKIVSDKIQREAESMDTHIVGQNGEYVGKCHPVDDLDGFANFLAELPEMQLERTDVSTRTLWFSAKAIENPFMEVNTRPVPELASQSIGDVELAARSVLENRVTLLVPTTFEPMSPKLIAQKYPSLNQPKVVFTNAEGSVNIAFQYGLVSIGPEILPKYGELVKALLQKTGVHVEWVSERVESVNGRDWATIDFRTRTVDTDVRIIMFVTSLAGKQLIVTVNVVQSLEREWVPIADAILQSVHATE